MKPYENEKCPDGQEKTTVGQLIEAVTTARAAWREQRDECTALAREVERLTGVVASAGRNGYGTLEARREDLATVSERLDTAKAKTEALDAAAVEHERALHEVRVARNAAREQQLRHELAIGETVFLRCDWRDWSSWGGAYFEVQLTEEKDGQRVRRFGFAAEVHGPRRKQCWSAETRQVMEEWGPAEINWGSIGSQPIQASRDLIWVHQLAVQLAEVLEAHRDAWFAEDMAD
jgi:hypothetical protein